MRMHPRQRTPKQALPFLHTSATAVGPARIDGPAQFDSMAPARAKLGFPSSADDFTGEAIDRRRLLVRKPAAME